MTAILAAAYFVSAMIWSTYASIWYVKRIGPTAKPFWIVVIFFSNLILMPICMPLIMLIEHFSKPNIHDDCDEFDERYDHF